MLEDALWAGVVDELATADQTFLHWEPAPGAEAIREAGWGRSWVRFRGGDVGHGRHSLRRLRTLSIDHVTPGAWAPPKKSFTIPSHVENFVV